MKTRLKNLFLLPALMASLSLIPARHTTAQVFTTLHNFTNGIDGANPYGKPDGLVLSGSTLFGAANSGGGAGNGTLFAINMGGMGFTNVYSFTALDVTANTNRDGASPNGLIISGSTLFGTATGGGNAGIGSIFAVNTNGLGFTNLHSFSAISAGTNSDGAEPYSGVILSGSTLYGTTVYGGTGENGSVYTIGTNGLGFTNLHSFSLLTDGTNSDGAEPYSGLILSGSTLYGTTVYGGSNDNGTIFAINTNGLGFTNLYTFTALNASTNGDGASPMDLILVSNTLYGTANGGGTGGRGTVFAVNTNGTGFTNLHSFTATDPITGANSDGANPFVGLILSGNTLYGTTTGGGSAGNGSLFAINTNGTGFTNLHSFTALTGSVNSDGASSYGGLVVSGTTLFGTAYNGGGSGYGTVFALSLAPQLTITPSATQVVITWPTNLAGFTYAGFSLQSATNLPSTNWSTNSTPPFLVNGHYTVTNPISGAQKFYRLRE